MQRTIVQADALVWMKENAATDDMSVITSLPDVSELALGFDEWRAWFIDAARAVIQWIPMRSVAIFYQSDIRHHGRWIDKSHLVMSAMDAEKATLLWHKIVCRKPPNTIALGRPSYSHMLCVARETRSIARPGPDVIIDVGDESTWSKAMRTNACRVACRFLREEVKATRIVVDPFCGRGSVLAMATSMGFDTVGIDISAKRCRASRGAVLTPDK